MSYIVALLCFAGRKITGERKKYGEKNVTIPEALFIDLVKYFLADIRWDEDRIRFGLQEKLEAMVKWELYTRYKTAGTPEEREKSRQEYLEHEDVQNILDQWMNCTYNVIVDTIIYEVIKNGKSYFLE